MNVKTPSHNAFLLSISTELKSRHAVVFDSSSVRRSSRLVEVMRSPLSCRSTTLTRYTNLLTSL